MIRPEFEVTQDPKYVIIEIQINHIKYDNPEFHIENNNFQFYLNPYLLNLYFPGNLLSSEQSTESYNTNSGMITCKIEKETEGEIFPNLDNPEFLFSTLATQDFPELEELGAKEELKDEGSILEVNKICNYYGFNNQFTKYFGSKAEIENGLTGIVEINPDLVPNDERVRIMKEKEKDNFDPERYLFDTFEAEEINELICQSHPYIEHFILFKMSNLDIKEENKNIENQFLTEEEQNCFEGIKKADVECKKESKTNLFCQLIDILFGFLYDFRINRFTSTCESHWTIHKLSATLSYFRDYNMTYPLHLNDVKLALITSFRRSLIYPLYRNFELCQKIQEDIYTIFEQGRRYILKCLLEIKLLLDKQEENNLYLLNMLYIDHFIIWLQTIEETELGQIALIMKKLQITKEELDLDIVDWEFVAMQDQKGKH